MMTTTFFRLYLLLFCCLLTRITMAQIGYTPGTINTKSGETIEGFIRNTSYPALRVGIHFKKNKKEKQGTLYFPDQLQNYVFGDGDRFESHPIPSRENQFPIARQNAFFHVLAKGKLSLFELNGKMASPLFIQKENGELQLLCLSKNGESDFRDLLFELMDNKISREALNKVPLKMNAIVDLVENYNEDQSLSKTRGKLIPYPRLNAWGYVGLAPLYMHPSSKASSKGGLLEWAPLANHRQWTVGLGGQRFIGKKYGEAEEILGNVIQKRQMDLWDWMLRANYYTKETGWASAYLFGGTRWTKGTQHLEKTKHYYDGSIIPIKETHEIVDRFKLHYGFGGVFFFGRHQFRLEFADFFDQLGLRIGYGFSLWK